MGVVNRVLYETADPQLAARTMGSHMKSARCAFEIANSDSSTSVYRLFNLPANAIIRALSICNSSGMTGTTNVDLGLYHAAENVPNLSGATSVIDKDLFAAGLSLASAHAVGAGQNGLVSLPLLFSEKRLWELAGATGPGMEASYDIALTGNTIGLTGGAVVVDIDYIIG